MFNSSQFQKLDFDVFSKKQLKENSLRSIYGGAESYTMKTIHLSTGRSIRYKGDTIDEEGCTRPIYDPNDAGKCDAPSTD